MGFSFDGGGSGGGSESIQSITFHDSIWEDVQNNVLQQNNLRVSPTARKLVGPDGSDPAFRIVDFNNLDDIEVGPPVSISPDGGIRDMHAYGEYFFLNTSEAIESYMIDGLSFSLVDSFDKHSVPGYSTNTHYDSCLFVEDEILYVSDEGSGGGPPCMAFDISSPENVSLIGTFSEDSLMAMVLANTGLSAYYDEDTGLYLSINTPQQTNFIPMDISSPLDMKADTAPQTSALSPKKSYNLIYSTLGWNGPGDIYMGSTMTFMETIFG